MPQLIPIQKPIRGEALGGSSSEAKAKFLQYVGFTKSDIDILSEDVLEPNVAEVLSAAVSHFCAPGVVDRDPYFTPQQWETSRKQVETVLDGFYQMAADAKVPPLDGDLCNKYNQLQNVVCQCPAHMSDHDWVYKLVDIPEPLTDDWGAKLSDILIPLIFETAAKKNLLPGFDVEGCRAGSLHTVNYILKLPSGDATSFTGWPDFTITRRYAPLAQERILRVYARRAKRLSGIGEIQSPPGNTEVSKTETIAQAGIYDIGQLAKTSQKKMAVIILFKDKSVQVAVATTHTPMIPIDANTHGEVEYRFVERVDSISLKRPQELQLFCRILVSTMRWTLEPET